MVGIPFEIELDFSRKKNRYLSKDGADFMPTESKDETKPIDQDYFKNQVFKDLDWDNFEKEIESPF